MKKYTLIKKTVATMLLLSLLVSSLVFASAETKPVELLTVYWGVEAPSKNGPFELYLEDFCESEFDIQWSPGATYSEKLSTVLASNNLPEVLKIGGGDTKNVALLSMQKMDQFWDLTDIIKEYPNLDNSATDVLKYNLSVDGRLYGIPRRWMGAMSAVLYREDWLKESGIEALDSFDALYEFCKYITSKSDDVYGIVFDKNFFKTPFQYASVAFGAPNRWGEKDGSVYPAHQAPQYLEAMNYFKKLYDEGLINKDFPAVEASDKFTKYVNGEAATIIENLFAYNALGGKLGDFAKMNPTGIHRAAIKLASPNGVFVDNPAGHDGMMLISKNTVKTEERLREILSAFDKLAEINELARLQDTEKGKEAKMIYSFGVEGDSYEMKDGVMIRDEAKFRNEYDPYHQFSVDFRYTSTLTGMEDEYKAIREENAVELNSDPSILVSNVCEPFVAETMLTIGSELDKIIEDGVIQYITGQIDEKGWEDVQAYWLSAGGEKLIEEMNVEYAKAK